MKWWRDGPAGAVLGGAVISAVVFAGTWGVRAMGGLESLELRAYDRLLTWLPTDDTFASEIVILGIDQDDVSDLGRYPITDAMMTDLLKRLWDCEPRAIGIDVYRDLEVPPGRDDLDRELKDNEYIVAVWKHGDTEAHDILPPSSLRNRPHQKGFADQVLDRDGVMRRALLYTFEEDQVEVDWSLDERLVEAYFAWDEVFDIAQFEDDTLRLGKSTYPTRLDPNHGGYRNIDTGGAQYMLDFRGGRVFDTFSRSEFLNEEFDRDRIRNKIVLIGITDPTAKDFIPTPFNEWEFGVKVQAMQVEHLLRGAMVGSTPIRSWSDRAEALWTLALCLVGSVLGMRVRSPVRVTGTVALGLAALFAVAYVCLTNGLWLITVPPAIGWTGSTFLATSYMSFRERRDRVVLRTLFEKNLTPELAATLWEQRDEVLENGRLRSRSLVATVLFTDLVGYSALSEKLSPEELLDWLNEYMEEMSTRVLERGGVVRRFIGDAVMALFGAPIPRDNEDGVTADARSAVRCALDMRDALCVLNDRWEREGRKRVAMRVGIFTGPLVSGSLGGKNRLEYTVQGDSVNTAARMESYEKSLMDDDIAAGGCRILIGGPTKDRLDDRYTTRHIGSATLRGKANQVEVYGVIDGPPDP